MNQGARHEDTYGVTPHMLKSSGIADHLKGMPRMLFAGIVCIALVALLCSAIAGWLPGTSARFPGLFGSAADANGDGGPNAENAVVAPGVVAGAVSATVGPADAPLPTAGGDVDVRDEVLGAYQSAVALAPSPCGLDVSLLAAIGQVESANLGGHQLDADNRPDPAIVGPALDGSDGSTAVPDTDSGEWDGDATWDRTVGPLAFIPGAWRLSGVDFDADGQRDPQDIEDASGAAMVFLCAGGQDLSTRAGLRSVVSTYNPASGYVELVLAWKAAFAAAGLDDAAAEPPELTAVQYAQVSRDLKVSSRRTADALDPSSPGIIPVADPVDPSDPSSPGGPTGGPPFSPGKPPPWVTPTPSPTPPGSTPTPGGPPLPPTNPTPSDPPSTRPSPTEPGGPGLGLPEPPKSSDPTPSDPPPNDPTPSDPPPTDPTPSDPPPTDPGPSDPPPSDPTPSDPPPNDPGPSDPPPNDPTPSHPPPNDPEPSDPPSSPAPTNSPEPSNPPPSDPEPSNPGPTSSPDPTSDPGPTSSPGSPSPSDSTSPSALEAARPE